MSHYKIGIIGNGNVGGTLKQGLIRTGQEVQSIGNNNQLIQDVIGGAEIIILAVPFAALDEVVKNNREFLKGKIVIDATNALDAEMNLALGFETSGAEELQKKLPESKIVKAFNTVFAQHMDTGQLNKQSLSTFIAGDDDSAKSTVLELAAKIGFDAIDAGPLMNARLLEPLAYLNIQLGYMLGMGTQIGFKLLHHD